MPGVLHPAEQFGSKPIFSAIGWPSHDYRNRVCRHSWVCAPRPPPRTWRRSHKAGDRGAQWHAGTCGAYRAHACRRKALCQQAGLASVHSSPPQVWHVGAARTDALRAGSVCTAARCRVASVMNGSGLDLACSTFQKQLRNCTNACYHFCLMVRSMHGLVLVQNALPTHSSKQLDWYRWCERSHVSGTSAPALANMVT